MLYLIDPSNYACHRQDLDNMYRLRDKVFLQKLKWDVKSQDGMEKDEYDEKDTYYIVHKDKQGIIRGCQRLIEMTNSCMFDGPFKFLFSDLKDFKRGGYWEVSRLAVDYEFDENFTQKDAQKVYASLLAAKMHFGLEVSKVEAFLCITFPSFSKLMASNGLLMAPLKQTTINGDTIVVSAYTPLRVSYEKLLKKINYKSQDPFLYYTGAMYANADHHEEFSSTGTMRAFSF